MPVTQRLYEKSQAAINVAPSISVTPSITLTTSVTPSISVTPSVTPSVTATPSITPTISLTPTPSTSTAYFYLANMFTCVTNNGSIECGQFIGQSAIYNGLNNFTVGQYYTGSSNRIYQPVSITTSGSGAITIDSNTSFASCILACSASYAAPTPSVTPSVSITPSGTPAVTPAPSQ
jgi:hypothetical protein